MASTSNPPKTSVDDELRDIYKTCIVGSHILHFHGVLDAYGHLSARHPTDPTVFLMPCNLAPANVVSPKDIVQYRVEDASAVDPNAPRGYLERFIHSEIYKRFPEVKAIIHSHASEVLPYANTSVPLRPCKEVPTFDISKHYAPDEARDLLIRTTGRGRDLAEYFVSASSSSSSSSPTQHHHHPVVLMRGHGCTVVGSGVQEAIYRAVYTKLNAAIQTASLHLARLGGGESGPASEVQYLRDDEVDDTSEMLRHAWGRAWGLWLREVEAAGLYRYSET
ncbi:hypothetical protein AYL99_11493 [Fonsecaea erecta]|uniref:Class II aldolase/adducin N-terminal domain-containing protein n=1 Tax=Fonsecaea erecta TaxID=1367422 RepID=A0A178Z3S1_9EURO|nr:hypothetical protein AYL99_11493 [Fonsecaea erecta]OAP54392.1 hypothetical protein AYL99_11493 [Fonsecaea erecta]